MKGFKRLTNDELNDFLQRAVVQLCPELTRQLLSIGLELAQYRDKVENGTLIELPRIIRYVDYCYGLEKFVVQWETNGKIKSKTFWSEKKAEQKLKELQNESH